MTPAEFMARAIEIGREGLNEKHARPFAAVIVKEGQIVGEGRSQQNALNDPTAHGEIVGYPSCLQSAWHDRSEWLRALHHL
jgi:guanine deaminase